MLGQNSFFLQSAVMRMFCCKYFSDSKYFLIVTAIATVALSELFLFWWILFVSGKGVGVLCWITAVISGQKIMEKINNVCKTCKQWNIVWED